MSEGLKIIVPIKQVPETTEVEFDEETGTLKREGVAAIINPFDEFAIEEGLRLKEKHGGEVNVLTMGPPWAADALRDAIAMGADKGWLVTDRAFAGADTWATSLTLAKSIEKMDGYDLIICGLKTTDGDTGQTGPEMAEHLNIPHVCYVNEIIDVKDGKVVLKRNLDDGVETLEAPLPLLITVGKDINQPRLATLRGRIKAKKAEIKEITNSDLQLDPKEIGLEGSFTRVVKIFEPEQHEAGEVVEGTVEELVDAIYQKLQECKVI
ncbi:MAG: electron transfer flavoprotein subunit beta/FixA family protein [Candidatus Bathyarchaeota archaeon]|nr:electron transfer flavoprotein subunit beta/FixA family protein [Candidatus Bathyarchaeota archaeon]